MALPPLYRFAACAFLVGCAVSLEGQTPSFTFDNAQEFLKSYCVSCHVGKSGAGGLRVAQFSTYDHSEQPWKVGVDPHQGSQCGDASQRSSRSHDGSAGSIYELGYRRLSEKPALRA